MSRQLIGLERTREVRERHDLVRPPLARTCALSPSTIDDQPRRRAAAPASAARCGCGRVVDVDGDARRRSSAQERQHLRARRPSRPGRRRAGAPRCGAARSIASTSRSSPAPKPCPASAHRRAARPGRRSGRPRRSCPARGPSRSVELERGARVVVDASHEGRDRSCTGRRTRRGRAAPRRSARRTRRRATRRSSARRGAPPAPARFLTSNTRSGDVARFCRAPSSSTSSCSSSQSRQPLDVRRPARASPIELSCSSQPRTPTRRSSSV